MEIDKRAEPLAREAIAGAVKKDPERFGRAITSFPDDETMTNGYRLALAVALQILTTEYPGNPSESEIREIAERVAELESWTDFTADEIATFLTAVLNRVKLNTVLPMERVVPLAYVLAADFLAGYCPEGSHWWEHLDKVEAALESR